MGQTGTVGAPSRTFGEDWLQNVERDVMALGGVVFYALVVGRSLVGPYWDLVTPLLVLGAVLLAAYPLLRSTDLYLTRALLVGVLVSRHYDDPIFATFTAVIYVLMIVAAVRLGRPHADVTRGVALGVVASTIGWLIAGVAE